MFQFFSLSSPSAFWQMLFMPILLGVLACDESGARDVLAVLYILIAYSHRGAMLRALVSHLKGINIRLNVILVTSKTQDIV